MINVFRKIWLFFGAEKGNLIKSMIVAFYIYYLSFCGNLLYVRMIVHSLNYKKTPLSCIFDIGD